MFSVPAHARILNYNSYQVLSSFCESRDRDNPTCLPIAKTPGLSQASYLGDKCTQLQFDFKDVIP